MVNEVVKNLQLTVENLSLILLFGGKIIFTKNVLKFLISIQKFLNSLWTRGRNYNTRTVDENNVLSKIKK